MLSRKWAPCLTTTEARNLLNIRFEKIPSLKRFLINFKVYPPRDPSDDITIMRSYGWTGAATELPKVWISNDDRAEFDNEKDCDACNNVQFRREVDEEERREKDLWLEEYYRRGREPYWKNDSERVKKHLFITTS